LQATLSETGVQDLSGALLGLRKEIEQISGLLDNAASYHVNLIQRMVEASGPVVQQRPCTESTGRLSLDV